MDGEIVSEQREHRLWRVLRSFGYCLLSVWLRLEGWRQRSRQRRALLALDDHLLKDIGLSRADALREGRKPFWKP